MKPFNPTSPTLTSCDRIWLVHERSGRRASFRVRENRRHKGLFLLGLEGIESLNDLEPWIGSSVEAESEAIPDAGAGEVYHFEVVGLEVRTIDGDSLGTIDEVMALPAQDVWVIRGTGPDGKPREILLPAVEPVVREIDLAGRVATVDPPPGLIEP